MKIVTHVKFWGFRYVPGKLGSIHVTELSNLDFKMVVLLLNRSSHLCLMSVSLSLLPKLLQSLIYVVHNLGLNLMTLINCCSKFLKMVLSPLLWNRIKMGDRWALENLFNNLFNNILDKQCPFFQRDSSYHCTHSVTLFH